MPNSDRTHHYGDLPEVLLHHVTAGAGDPVVLLHGWPQTWSEWRRILPALAARYRVIAPDPRGLDGAKGRGRGAEVVESLRRVAADVRGEVVPDRGHWIPEEQPDLLADRLIAFFGEADSIDAVDPWINRVYAVRLSTARFPRRCDRAARHPADGGPLLTVATSEATTWTNASTRDRSPTSECWIWSTRRGPTAPSCWPIWAPT